MNMPRDDSLQAEEPNGPTSMNRILYNLLLHTVVAPFLAAYYVPRIVFTGKYRRSLGGKLGRLPADFRPEHLKRPRIWFHAVSVGEVVALAPLVAATAELVPQAGIVISTGTETGQVKAAESIRGTDGLFYLPLDFPSFVNRVVDRIQPDLFVLMETELWPNLIHSLKASGARVALANGRISDRSFPRYRRLRSFFAPTLRQIDLFLMASELDGSRIAEMGAPRDRIHVTGNTKFDAALGRIPVEAEIGLREMFDLEPTAQVLVAGSTHPGEHEIVLDAFRKLREKFPDLILILVPRHVEKTPLVLAAMKERDLDPPFLRSSADTGEKRNGRHVIVVDRTGELFGVFSLASAVFIGGSLVPKGGQNILEPAAWGKMVLFGPSMEDFRDAREMLLHTGAGIEVTGADDLARRLEEILADPQAAIVTGGKGRDEILRHVGSSGKTAELLKRFIPLADVSGVASSINDASQKNLLIERE
jgi:3-deoxy-D-manno-octulosonic-acid transferase